MFDRKHNEQYLFVNQQLDVVWMNAYLSIKRKSGEVTSIPYYWKICPTDGKRGSFQWLILEMHWMTAWPQQIPCLQSSHCPDHGTCKQTDFPWANFTSARRTAQRPGQPARGWMDLWVGGSSFGHVNIAVNPQTGELENLLAICIGVEIEASAIIYVDDPD